MDRLKQDELYTLEPSGGNGEDTMKKFMMLAMLAVMLSACTEATEYGECIGLNSAMEDPELIYEYNAWNIGVGIIFAELIIPPIVVVLDQLKCPVGTTVEATVPVVPSTETEQSITSQFTAVASKNLFMI